MACFELSLHFKLLYIFFPFGLAVRSRLSQTPELVFVCVCLRCFSTQWTLISDFPFSFFLALVVSRHRRYTSQLVIVQSASRSSEALALALRSNGKGRGPNRARFSPQQVYGLVVATSRFEQ